MNQNKEKSQQTSVQQEMDQVQDAVDHISYLRNCLDEKSQKLKSEIKSSFSTIFDQLHAREEQLLRQVDVVTNNQRTSLCTQIAKMYYLMGRLKTNLDSLENDENDIEKLHLQVNDIDSVKKICHQNLPSYSLHLDTNQLEKPIQDFGRLDVLRTLLNFPPPEGSRSLPSSVEDYQMENEDHHVMHKTLFDQNSVKIRPPVKYNFDIKEKDCNEWTLVDKFENESQDTESITIIDQSRALSPYEVVGDSSTIYHCSTKDWLISNGKTEAEKCDTNDEIEDLQTTDNPETDENDKWLIKQCKIEPVVNNKTIDDNKAIDNKNKTIDNTCKPYNTCIFFDQCEEFHDELCDDNCPMIWLSPDVKVPVNNGNLNKNKQITRLLEPIKKIMWARNEDYLSKKKYGKSNLYYIDNSNWLAKAKAKREKEPKQTYRVKPMHESVFKYFLNDVPFMSR